MPDPLDLAPLSVRPQIDVNRAAERDRRNLDVGARDVGIAAVMQTPTASVFNLIDRSPLWFEDEPGFNLTPESDLFKSLTEGVDPAYWPQFADAVSTRHAYYIRNQIDNKQKYREQIQTAGASGMAATTLAGMLDPVYLAAGVLSGGAGFAVGASRLTQLARAGIVSGELFAGIETLRSVEDPMIGPGEIALAGVGGGLGAVAGTAFAGAGRGVRFIAGGAAQAAPQVAYDVLSDADRQDIMLNVIPQFFIGGVTNAIHPATSEHAVRLDKAARSAMKTVEKEIVTQAGATLTPKGEAYFRPIDSLTEVEKFNIAMGHWSPFEQALGIDRSKPDTTTITVEVPNVPQNFADLMKEPKSDFQKLLDGESTAPATKQVSVEVPIRPSELTFADVQRIMAQVEAEHLPTVTVGDAPEQSPPPFKPAADTSGVTGGAVGAASPWELSPSEHASFVVRREGLDTQDVTGHSPDGSPIVRAGSPSARTVPSTRRTLQDGFAIGSRVNAELLDNYNAEHPDHPLKLPDGYVREGNFYSPQQQPSGAVGAASANDPAFAVRGVEKINEQPGDLNLNGVGDEKASFWARFDIAGRTARAASSVVRRAANMLGVDHVPKQSGQTYYSVPEWVTEKHNANMGELLPAAQETYRAYRDAEKKAGREPMNEKQFRESAKAVYESGTPSGNAHLDRLVEAVRKVRKSDWERMQRHGVPGAVDREFDPTVIDRYTDRAQLDEAIGIHGYDAMLDDIIERMRRHPANAELAKDADALRAVAKAWLDNAATQQDRVNVEAAHTLETESVAIYASKLRKAVPTLTDAQINDIIYTTGPEPSEGSTPAKLRRQVRMDAEWENPALQTFHSPVDGQIYSGTTFRAPADTVVGKPFKLNDILVRDIVEIEAMNSRYMNGRAGMAEVYRQFSTPERQIESLGGLLDLMKERGATDDEVTAIEFMAKVAMGIPNHKTTRFTKIARVLRNASYARVINQATGIRNFGEIAGIISENGLDTIVKHLTPSVRDVFEQMRTGKASSETAIEMYQMGFGLEELQNRILPQSDESDYVPKAGGIVGMFDKGLNIADRWARKMANLTSTLSLVGPTQTVLEHLSFRTTSQVWLNFAQGKTTVSNERIAAAGIRSEMVDRIKAEIAKPGTVAFDATPAGNVWQGFNWDKWSDVEAATALRQGIIKTIRRQVYKPTASELPKWAQSDVGKVFFQLRTFVFGSWASKTLHSVNLRDRAAVTSAGAQMLSKGLLFAGLTYLYSFGRPDREKYLRDRLALDKIAKAAFSNAEVTSLVPLGVDIVQAAQGKAPVFAFARTTGLGDAPGVTGLLTSNPTADTIDKAFRTAGLPLRKAMDAFEYHTGLNRSRDPRITDKDVKAIQGGLPWQKFFVIDQVFRRIAEAAPRGR